MEREYEERKKRLKERYQARKRRYEEAYKAEEVKAEVPPEIEVKIEGAPEVEVEVKPEAPVVEEVVESVLTNIEGIGATRATKLEEAGIKTLEDLAGAIPREIAEIAGVSNSVASYWIEKAEEVQEQHK
ncbi:MAG: helix-hairpin-helix domain-containing protein [Halobacteriota archaeon]